MMFDCCIAGNLKIRDYTRSFFVCQNNVVRAEVKLSESKATSYKQNNYERCLHSYLSQER